MKSDPLLFSEDKGIDDIPLLYYENLFISKGYNFIAGVDEVGRGSLAGPVVASAVILPPKKFIKGVNDSKLLSKIERESLFKIISEEAISIGIGIVNCEEIDRINILNASLLAMKLACNNLKVFPNYILVDGKFPIPNLTTLQKTIIRGDQKSISIAAASIIAKVTRDKIMADYHILYPQYHFEKNKGYATKEHKEALIKYGASPIHRRSFKGVILK